MLTLKLKTGNAAFDEPGAECARILRDAANKIERGDWDGNLQDFNGNTVGAFKLTTKR